MTDEEEITALKEYFRLIGKSPRESAIIANKFLGEYYFGLIYNKVQDAEDLITAIKTISEGQVKMVLKAVDLIKDK